MDPNGAQFSIKDPFSDNASHCPRSPLPRSFTLAGHGRQTYGVFSRLSPSLSPSKSFTLTFLERQVYGVSLDLSINHSHAPSLDLFSLSSVGGNSRALLLATIQENKTRILFVSIPVWQSILGLLQHINLENPGKCPATVITGTSGHGWPFCDE